MHLNFNYKDNYINFECHFKFYNNKNRKIFTDLSGQFAIAIHDKKEKKLLLIRDQFGVCPFYYTIENQVVSFGTNIKSILQNQMKAVQMNRKVIHEYFMYR